MEAIEATGVHPQIRISKPALGACLQLAFGAIGIELQIIHKAEQPAGDGGMEIGTIGFHQLHPIESQHHREEMGQGFLGIRHGPACLGAVGGRGAGGQPMVLHPKVGGDGTLQVQQGGLRWKGGEEGTAKQEHQGEKGCHQLHPRATGEG